MNFLKESTLSLWTKVNGQANDTLQRPNLCNPDRIVDITTLYLARALGLSVSNIVSNFVFDEGKTYTFPNHSTSGPSQIYPPVGLTAFPNLEQTYWTIISQYTANTEPSMRTRNREYKWCWIKGKGLYDHCEATLESLSCQSSNPILSCMNLWKFFVEACHRVHSLNTLSNDYQIGNRIPGYTCLPWISGRSFFEISKLWDRGCSLLENNLAQFADNTRASGSLQISGPGAESNANYRIPGTEFKYKCSSGYYLPDKTNPDQMLQCQGNRLVDTSHITNCIRKIFFEDLHVY